LEEERSKEDEIKGKRRSREIRERYIKKKRKRGRKMEGVESGQKGRKGGR